MEIEKAVMRKIMKTKKAIVFGVLLALAFIAFTGIASASTIYVSEDSTIQAAVNAAYPGDTIIVRDGTYTENIKVDKRLTIRSENGPDSTIVVAEDPGDPVFEVTADYVKISGFTVEGAAWRAGIRLYFADYCNISNNNCSNNGAGIALDDSNNNCISNNNCSNNNWEGIDLHDSNNNKLTGNLLLENGIVIWGRSLSHYTNEIDTSNTVNGKPVYYWNDVEGGRIPDGAGQVILVNCKNIVVENQNLKNASSGMQITFSSGITIKNNNCSNNWEGIDLHDSNNNCISNNNCLNNNWEGIELIDSNNNSISNNNCSNNEFGIRLGGDSNDNSISKNKCSNNRCAIYLKYSNNNCISNNTCSNNMDMGIHLEDSNNNCISDNNCSNSFTGILLWYSNNNSISNNNCSNNKHSGIYLIDSNNNSISNNNCTNNNVWAGISLGYSNNNKLKGNVMVGNGVFITGGSLSDYTHEIDESNTVNGKPVYYWKNIEGGRIPDGAGQVILVNCKNVVVENLNLTNASVGMGVAFSSYITIKNNNCSNNSWSGIYLSCSNNNSISNNNCSNDKHGIDLWDSNNNLIYLNSFINNAYNVYSSESTNTWNSTEKITYSYGRRTYTSYFGNYWGDYTGTDRNRDGIGDTPYQIDGDRDMYPLMKRWENYFAPSEQEIAPSERPSEVIYFILRWILED